MYDGYAVKMRKKNKHHAVENNKRNEMWDCDAKHIDKDAKVTATSTKSKNPKIDDKKYENTRTQQILTETFLAQELGTAIPNPTATAFL